MERAEATGSRAAGFGFSGFVKLLSLLLVSGILTLHLSVVRPLRRQLEVVQQEMHEVRSRMDLLAAQRDQVRNANDLLSLLNAQRTRVEESYGALKSIRQFRSEVELEALQADGVV